MPEPTLLDRLAEATGQSSGGEPGNAGARAAPGTGPSRTDVLVGLLVDQWAKNLIEQAAIRNAPGFEQVTVEREFARNLKGEAIDVA